ncbi:MAG: DUF3015 domain-containing protein [Nitrospinota bacterium]|nr:DUF3015 domain-containing protein [Nitrospinota bacterium]
MKKLIVSIVSFSAVLVFASGASAHNQGCGLGDQVFPGADTVLTQLFAITTNGTFANQTFGITSGTSGCVPPRSFVFNDDLTKYVASNMDNIAKDMAQGNGESLDTLAEMMDVPSNNRLMFNTALQSNFSSVFSHEGIEAGELIENIAFVAQNHHVI